MKSLVPFEEVVSSPSGNAKWLSTAESSLFSSALHAAPTMELSSLFSLALDAAETMEVVMESMKRSFSSFMAMNEEKLWRAG